MPSVKMKHGLIIMIISHEFFVTFHIFPAPARLILAKQIVRPLIILPHPGETRVKLVLNPIPYMGTIIYCLQRQLWCRF